MSSATELGTLSRSGGQTVKTHVSNLLRKLHGSRPRPPVIVAYLTGLVTPVRVPADGL